MMKTSARLLGASILVLGLMASHQTAHAGNGKSAVAKLPKSTGMVMVVNVDRAKKSGLFKDALAMAKKDPEMAKGIDMLKAQAGFDIRKHVKTLIVGFDKNFDTTQKAVVMIEGKFNPKKFVKFAKASSKSVADKSHGGISYWEIDGDTEMALIKNYMVITKKGGMTSMIDVHKGKAANAKKNGELMRVLGGTDTSKDLWFAGVLPQSLRNQAKGMLGGNTVNGVTVSLDIKSGLSAKLRIIASSSAAAQALSGLLQMGLSQGANDPSLKAMGLGAAMSKIVIKAKASDVHVLVKLSKSELTKITNILKSFAP